MERWLKGRFLSGFTVAVALLCLGPIRLQAATFTASLDRDTIALGETATLSLTFEGSQPGGAPQMRNIPGLQIQYVGPSSQFSFVNGQTSSTVTYHFTVASSQPGEYTIPALTAQVDGQSLTSQPLKLTVTQPNAPTAAEVNSGSQIAFMKLTLPKNGVYDGEALSARLDIYLRDDVQNFADFQFTSTPVEGLVIGKRAQGNQQRVQIGNRLYTDVPLSLALTVTKPGPISIGPFTASAVIVVASPDQRRDFFGMLAGGEQRQITLASDTITAQSLPLPTNGKPANFNGAIGSYTMTVSAGPTNVAVGDPITVHVQISGRGALDAIALPDQPAWHDFKTYPPTSKVETSDALGLQGAKSFEQIVTPQNTDVHELPAFSFSYFDPETGSYHTLTEPSVQLAIHSAGASSTPVMATGKTTSPQAPSQPQDILPIKDQIGTLTQTAAPLLTQPGFWAAQSLPVLAWFAAFIWRKRADNLANNPRLRRQRQVAQLVRDGLADLHRFADENKSEEFFATLFRLLQEQLGARLDCPASSITEAVIDERLVSLGVPETTLKSLRELFHLNNQARYAPLRTSGELAAVLSQFESVVRELQKVNA